MAQPERPWEFEIDQGDSGVERGLLDRELAAVIVVPFAPESSASGVGCGGFTPFEADLEAGRARR